MLVASGIIQQLIMVVACLIIMILQASAIVVSRVIQQLIMAGACLIIILPQISAIVASRVIRQLWAAACLMKTPPPFIPQLKTALFGEMAVQIFMTIIIFQQLHTLIFKEAQ